MYNNLSALYTQYYFSSGNLTIDCGGIFKFDNSIISNGLHSHDCYELCYVISGKGVVIHNKEEFTIEKGSVFIAEPNVLHEIHVKYNQNTKKYDHLELIFFFINISLQEGISMSGSEEKIIHQFVTKHRDVVDKQLYLESYIKFINDFATFGEDSYYGCQNMTRCFIIECLANLTEIPLSHNKQPELQSSIDLAQKFIGRNINKKIRVSEVAGYACTSQRNLEHLFRKNLNKTIIEYINEKKITVSTTYLKMNLTIGEVATNIGIEEVSQFSRMFKKYNNISPKEYQNRYATNRTELK